MATNEEKNESGWGWEDWTKFFVGTGVDVYKSNLSSKNDMVATKAGSDILQAQAEANKLQVGNYEFTTGQMVSVAVAVVGLGIAFRLFTKQ